LGKSLFFRLVLREIPVQERPLSYLKGAGNGFTPEAECDKCTLMGFLPSANWRLHANVSPCDMQNPVADVGKACFFQLLGAIVVLTSAAEASSLGPAKLVGEGDEMNSHRLSQLTVL
jgi:hypothetical protein